MLITSIYTLLGTYLRGKYFKISQASSWYFKLIQNISKYFKLIQYISRNLIGNIPNYTLDEKWMNYIYDDVKHDLSMKEGCLFVLFCLYLWDPLNQDALDHILGVFRKLLKRRGAWAWFHDVWTCGAKVFEYWMIFSLEIKLNHSWKFWRNWNVPLVLLKRSWWGDLMEFIW
jgi:hypothetical protein